MVVYTAQERKSMRQNDLFEREKRDFAESAAWTVQRFKNNKRVS